MTSADLAEPPKPHVLARIGPHTIAVEAGWVHQARDAAELVAPPPRRGVPLAGLLPGSRGALPVLALEQWLHDLPAPEPVSHVLVLSGHGRRVGLRVDALLGTATIATSQMRRLHHQDADHELFDSVVQLAPDDAPLLLLEVQRLMALAAVWAAEGGDEGDGTPAQDPKESARERKRTVAMAVLRTGALYLAVPATAIAEVVPMPALEQRWNLGGITQGLAWWRGRALAVLALGVGSGALGVVLQQDTGRLLLPVDELIGMTEQDPDWHPAETGTPLWCQACALDGRDRMLHLLELGALMQLPEARISADTAHEEVADALDRNERAFLVIQAGLRYAVPVGDVQAVLEQAGAVGDLVPWRERSLPVRSVLDGVQRGDLLLVVGPPDRHFAQPVEQLLEFVPPRAGRLHRLPGDLGGRGQWLSVGERSYVVRSLAD